MFFLRICIFVLSAFLVGLLLYLGFGTGIHVFLQRVLFVFLILLLWFLYRIKEASSNKIRVLYLFLTLLLSMCTLYYLSGSSTDAILEKGIFGINIYDTLITWILLVFILLCTAKQIGYLLASIGAFFLLYALFGNIIEGMWGHKGYDMTAIAQYLGWGLEGVFSSPIGAVVNFVGLYILFGELLDAFGAGKVFIDFSYRLTSGLKGATAQAAVLSSAFMGTINGSAVANVMTTGTFTIPLMQKVGYSRKYAAAVEAVASTGGQIAPPVMGAVAFVMADMSGISYSTIVTAALLPALLYYASLFFSVYLYASKYDLTKENLQERKEENKIEYKTGQEDKKNKWQQLLLFLPLLCLLYLLLFKGFSAQYAVLFAMALLVIIGIVEVFLKERRFPFKEFKKVILSTAQTCVLVSIACMTAGIVIGIVNMTGIGVQFAHILFSFSQSFSFILCMVMLASLVLGMGLPSTAAYSVVALVCAPILVELGVDKLTAHMFVFYFAVISFITPPIGIASYAAASIAKSDFFKTSIKAFILGSAGFIIPFLFVYRPELLLQKGLFPALLAFCISIFALFIISASFEGYCIRVLKGYERIFCIISAFLLLIPSLHINILGFVLISAFIVFLVVEIREKRLCKR